MINKEIFLHRTIKIISDKLNNILPSEETLEIMIEKRNEVLNQIMENK